MILDSTHSIKFLLQVKAFKKRRSFPVYGNFLVFGYFLRENILNLERTVNLILLTESHLLLYFEHGLNPILKES